MVRKLTHQEGLGRSTSSSSALSWADQPSSRSSLAVASPIPDDDPVIRANLELVLLAITDIEES